MVPHFAMVLWTPFCLAFSPPPQIPAAFPPCSVGQWCHQSPSPGQEKASPGTLKHDFSVQAPPPPHPSAWPLCGGCQLSGQSLSQEWLFWQIPKWTYQEACDRRPSPSHHCPKRTAPFPCSPCPGLTIRAKCFSADGSVISSSSVLNRLGGEETRAPPPPIIATSIM